MRRLALATALLAAILPASAHADALVGAPITHGADGAALGSGPEAPLPAAGASSKRAAAKLLPSTWCGDRLAADDTVHEVDNGAYRYHAVYMLAADATDRFDSVVSTLQTDAFQASALLETSYGRAIRFDMGTSCGPQYLDISVVRMPETKAQMAALAESPDGTFDAVARTLDATGFETIQPTDDLTRAAARTRNYLVWLEAPTAPGTCGQASIYDDPARTETNLNNFGGKAAVVFRNGPDAFCSSNAVRHEIGHNLGALQSVAPHAFDGSHCDDAWEDTMCYTSAPRVADGRRGLFFDYGNDDYWDPPTPGASPLPWWTVNLNRFLCPDATCNVAPGAVADEPTAAGSQPAAQTLATEPRRTPRRARLLVRAARSGHGVWKVKLHASGEGAGVVLLRCRRRPHGQVRTVYSRYTRLPRTLHSRVRCSKSRPRARLLVDY